MHDARAPSYPQIVGLAQRRALGRLLGAGLVLLALLGLALSSVPTTRANDDLVAHRLRIPLTNGNRSVTLWVARGFDIGVAATGVPSARVLAQSPSGDLVLSQMFEGKVSRLIDRDGDGVFEDRSAILRNLEMPHGLAFVGDALYVATSDQILRLDRWSEGSTAREVAKLPGGGQHLTRTLALGPDGILYVSVGSSCDACTEADGRRASILRMDPNGGPLEPVANGIRNAVGMTWSPYGQLWVTDNGRNDLGDEIPPDEVNVVRTGADYGWPDCYADRIPVTPGVPPGQCAGTEPPIFTLPAHIAPLGLTFYETDRAPPEYRGDLLIALHGSAVRSEPVGYELVRVPMRDGRPQAPSTFVRGWLVDDDSWGRPVFPFVAQDGTLYVSDDKGGVVYWIRPSGSQD
jgi:glucose/arabinose dehydrogenase